MKARTANLPERLALLVLNRQSHQDIEKTGYATEKHGRNARTSNGGTIRNSVFGFVRGTLMSHSHHQGLAKRAGIEKKRQIPLSKPKVSFPVIKATSLAVMTSSWTWSVLHVVGGFKTLEGGQFGIR
jgi:hypothetical protein